MQRRKRRRTLPTGRGGWVLFPHEKSSNRIIYLKINICIYLQPHPSRSMIVRRMGFDTYYTFGEGFPWKRPRHFSWGANSRRLRGLPRWKSCTPGRMMVIKVYGFLLGTRFFFFCDDDTACLLWVLGQGNNNWVAQGGGLDPGRLSYTYLHIFFSFRQEWDA